MSVLGCKTEGLSERNRGGRVEEPRKTSKRKGRPNVEQLERLLLLSTGCPDISGYVFLDENHNPVLTNNGHFDPGELPVPGAQVLLFDSSHNLLARATTNAQGFYIFDGLPNPNATPVSLPAQTVSLGATLTPFNNNQFSPSAIQLFNPDLGTLKSVTIKYSANLNSTVNTQNLSPSSPADITASLNGSYAINGLSTSISGTGSDSKGPFTDAPYDPSNPNANKLPPIALSSSNAPPAMTLTSAAELAFFTASAGRTTITPTMSATALATATSNAGGLNTSVVTTAGGSVTVTYTYIPEKCISPGTYTLVQTPNPPQLINGKESQPGVVFPAPPDDQPQMLSVTVGQNDLPNNDFAKLTPGAVCPTIGSIVRYGVHHQQTTLVLTFVGPVNPALANNPNNYVIKTHQGGHIKIVSANFDPATNAVTLIPAHRLNLHFRYDLAVTLPCTGSCNNVVVPFGGKQDLGGFLNHLGQFVKVVDGHIPRWRLAERMELRAAHHG